LAERRNGESIDLDRQDLSKLLHVAVKHGHVKVVKLLVENGADVRARDDMGRTALRFAIDDAHDEIAAYLRENGAIDRVDLDETLARAWSLVALNPHKIWRDKITPEQVGLLDSNGWPTAMDCLRYYFFKGDLFKVKELMASLAESPTSQTFTWLQEAIDIAIEAESPTYKTPTWPLDDPPEDQGLLAKG